MPSRFLYAEKPYKCLHRTLDVISLQSGTNEESSGRVRGVAIRSDFFPEVSGIVTTSLKFTKTQSGSDMVFKKCVQPYKVMPWMVPLMPLSGNVTRHSAPLWFQIGTDAK